jgi:hypothetical protein
MIGPWTELRSINDVGPLSRVKTTPTALRKIIEMNAIDGNTLQIDHRMTKQLSDPSNLAIPPLP